jgi:hypothetical protein
MFVLPIEHSPKKFLPANIVPSFVFRFAEVLFDRGLRPDSGMIGPGQPKHLETLHPRAACENVLDRVIEDMPEGQDTGDIGRWDDDGKRRLGRIRIRAEAARFLPMGIPFRLHRAGIVGFGQLCHREE